MNSFLPPQRLRDLIRSIRACKTAAEERQVINKESADIRNSFRDDDTTYRCRSVAKLLYIHMLGYPAHFGQMEVMKLSTSQRFTDKRIGYLGAMLLLDENREVSMLITNCIQQDLNSPNQYVVSLALCTLGNICSNDMARDLTPDVERLMQQGNPYLKKKAILCACRIVKKVPELVESFLEPSQKLLLSEKNHGVVLSACSLVIEMCKNNRKALEKYRKLVGAIVRMLKTLVVSGYSPEHDVSGISDPFLQVHLIKLLRVLGKNDDQASDKMNDILAQIATNTETSKNVGNAILYETVLTIMEIKSESGLRVLAVNILGRFLLHSDKNIRYVALNSLLQCVGTDSIAIQRHRATILDCLKDPDSSILKRAMELCFALMNPTTVRGTTRELLLFMESCPPEFKGDCASGLTQTADKYSPNAKWHVETLFKVLVVGGNHIRDDSLVASLVQRISSHAELQPYSVRALYRAVRERPTYQPLAQAACWSMGEFAQYLLESDDEGHVAISEKQVVGIIEKILETRLSSDTTRQYAINALVKLSTRLGSEMTSEIRDILLRYGSSLDVELQQRALEYSVIFTNFDNMRAGLLEPMPPYEKIDDEAVAGEGESGEANLLGGIEAPKSGQGEKPSDDLLNLVGFDGGDGASASEPAKPANPNQNILDMLDLGGNSNAATTPSTTGITSSNDLLGMLGSGGSTPQPAASNNTSSLDDILGLGGSSTSTTPTAATPTSNTGVDDLLAGLSVGGSSSTAETASAPAAASAESSTQNINIGPLECFKNEHFKVQVKYEKEPGNKVAKIYSRITYLSGPARNNFLFQVAVPKTQQVHMMEASSKVLSEDNTFINQIFRVNNPESQPLRFRFRFVWVNTEGVEENLMAVGENIPDNWV